MFGNCVYSPMYIPEELIVEILKKLPAKSLLRFMSVCKSWYYLIKNPNFISYHFNHQINQGPRYLVYRKSQNLREYYVHEDTESFDRHLEFTYPIICYLIGCCNGIVCFNHIRIDTSFVLWNSSLRKSLDIKVPHCILSDDEKSACGFGFDEKSNDYKLVWFGYSTSESWETRPLGVYIYSLNERAWRCVNSSFLLDDEYLFLSGVYLNGVMHWVAERYYDERDMPELILTFNLAHETFGVFHLPSEIVYVEPDYDYLGNEDYACPQDSVFLMTVKSGSKNCLAALHDDMTNLKLWVMEDDGIVNSWRKEFSISKGSVKKILNVRMNGEIVMQLQSGGVVSLDHSCMRLKDISLVDMYYEGTYMESLVLL